MNNLKKITSLQYLFICLSFFAPLTSKNGSEQIKFSTENGAFGTYNPTKSQAYIDDQAFCKVIAIHKSDLRKPRNKRGTEYKNYLKNQKARKGKIYLGRYQQNGHIYYLYGINKYQKPENNGPLSDVKTEIQITVDYGPDEERDNL